MKLTKQEKQIADIAYRLGYKRGLNAAQHVNIVNNLCGMMNSLFMRDIRNAVPGDIGLEDYLL